MNTREFVNGMLFGGQHEEIIRLIERQGEQLTHCRDALERIAEQHTHPVKGWVHWRQIARDALDEIGPVDGASTPTAPDPASPAENQKEN